MSGILNDDRPAVFRFGPYTLNTCPYELRREGEVVPLQPQPARLLELLAARAGQPVTREEIRSWIWGDDTYVDFDQAINFLIRRLRKTLGDDANQPRYIETVPRIGYRFVATVEDKLPRPDDAARRPARVAAVLTVAASVLLLTAALLAFKSRPAATPAVPSPETAVSEEAQELYSRGVYLLQSEKPESQELALTALQSAVGLEPEYLDAITYLAFAHLKREDLPAARSWAERALEVDSTSPDAHTVLATLAFLRDNDWARAEEHYQKAVTSEPVETTALLSYSIFLSAMARHDKAIQLAQKALATEPASAELRRQLAFRYFYARRYDEAIEEARDLLELTTRASQPHWLILDSHLLSGRPDEALEQMNVFLEAWGWTRFADPQVFWQRTLSNGRGYGPETRAWVHLHLGDRSTALELVRESACAAGLKDTRTVRIGVDPRLDGLRSEPGFQEILGCLKLAGHHGPALVASRP